MTVTLTDGVRRFPLDGTAADLALLLALHADAINAAPSGCVRLDFGQKEPSIELTSRLGRLPCG